jgi:hypothetical protein
MAIEHPAVEVTQRIKKETASSLIALRRVPKPDLTVDYPISVTYVDTIYEVDALDVKTKLLGEENNVVFDLTPEEVFGFFTTMVTYQGQEVMLGNLVAGLTDDLIRARLGL